MNRQNHVISTSPLLAVLSGRVVQYFSNVSLYVRIGGVCVCMYDFRSI